MPKYRSSPRSVRLRAAFLAWSIVATFQIIVSLEASGQPQATLQAESGWVLRDTSNSNITNMDPVQIVDSASINTLSNVYEGLVATTSDGRIVPGIARSWEVSPDGKLWTFHLRTDVTFHPLTSSCNWRGPTNLTSADVVASLVRAITSPASVYKWIFADLIEGASAPAGSSVTGITAPDAQTVTIRLNTAFPLLNRLATVAGWIYPAGILEGCGATYLARNPVGTGPLRLAMFVPDDRVELTRFANYHGGVNTESPSRVTITIQSDPAAALEAFKANRVDILELSLGTIAEARRLSEMQSHRIEIVTGNYLDYLVMNNRQSPYNDIRIRQAINEAIDRDGLARTLGGTVEPAFGFIPPVSPAYLGKDKIRQSGFKYNPTRAKEAVQQYLSERGIPRLELDLLIDSGDLPETVGQYVQASLAQNLGATVRLTKVTWPELLQRAFAGQSAFYRFWWNIVTPSDDIYFQFFFPGREPPKGFNMSFYDDSSFASRYREIYGSLSLEGRLPGIHELESKLITSAAAVPLFHKKFLFLVRHNTSLSIDGFLRKHYSTARRAAGAQ